jgi:hypothetical protein
MSKMSDILNAANQTSEYIELMRLPSKSQGITKYSVLKFQNGKPKLKDTGFTMLSPRQSTIDKVSAFSTGYVFGPLVLASALFDKMKKKENQGMIEKHLNTGLIATGAILTSFGLYKSMCYSRTETLVFPKSPIKSLKG